MDIPRRPDQPLPQRVLHAAALALVPLFALAEARPATQSASGAGPGAAATAESYCARFGAALAALDAGDDRRASALFMLAGEAAPEAPVWRVHAGVALLRADDGDGAEARLDADDRDGPGALFRAALALGYPPSDLAALEPRAAALAALQVGGDGEARADWVTVAGGLAAGLAGVPPFPSDVRHARFRPPVTLKLAGLTHIVGVPGTPTSSTLHFFRVDPASGRIERVPPEDDALATRARHESNYGYVKLAYVDDAAPWPRGKPLVRALRTGLLLDHPEARLEHELLRLGAVDVSAGKGALDVQTGYAPESRRRIDLQRLHVARGGAGPGPTAGNIEEVSEAQTLERVKALLGRGARVWRIRGGPADVGECVLAAPHIRYDDQGARAWPMLLVLDPEGARVVAELDAATTDAARRTIVSCGRPAFDPGSARLIVPTNAAGGSIEAFDTADWSLAWRVDATSRSSIAREVSLTAALVFASSPDEARTDVWRLSDGAPVVTQRGYTRIGASPDGSCIVAEGLDALHVIDARAFAAGPARALASPRLTLWLQPEGPRREREAVVAVASDGTWLASPLAAVHAHVLLGDTLVPAESVAPWLFDPLHVRSALADEDPGPRRFPRPR